MSSQGRFKILLALRAHVRHLWCGQAWPRPRLTAARVAIAALCLLVLGPCLAATNVTIVVPDSGAIYRETADALYAGIAEDASWQVRIQAMSERRASPREELVIPLGISALQAVLGEEGSTPVWALLVPREAIERAGQLQGSRASHPLSALYLDQPIERSFRMMRAALPGATRAGVLLGPGSIGQLEALRAASKASGITLEVEPVRRSEELLPSLEALSMRVDLILLLPDTLVSSRSSLQLLLLRTYQLHLPVVSYSLQLNQAGTMLALYAAPGQIGREAAARLLAADRKRGLHPPASDYPESFTVAINRSVALSLDIALPPDDLIHQRIEKGAAP